jgi:hypothetical protein
VSLLVPLQALDDYLGSGGDGTGSPDMLQAALDDLVAAAGGEAIFGVLIGGTLILSLWIAGDGDLATPSVITVLLGAIMFPLLPGTYLGIARVITFIGLTAATLAAVEKYYLEGTQ